ncbi:hypothetical protein AJ87_14140 [Rhizobium yanglingense]|nr:hypothetical protein AJ87_14140 [Rhizobium yanglingense]
MQGRSPPHLADLFGLRSRGQGKPRKPSVFPLLPMRLAAHADHNAAINILRRNTASMIVEEGQRLSVEAITIGGASRPLGNPPLASGGRC